jgi:hypothetical protein
VKRWAPTLVQEEGLNDAPCPDLILGCASHTLRGAPAREPWKLPPLGATFKPPGHPGPACRKTRLAPRRPLQCDPLDARHLASGLPLATALLDFPPGSRTKPHRTRRLCSLGAWVVAHHISLRLVRRCFPPLRCPSAPCFATRWDVIAALPQTLNSHVAPALVLAGEHTRTGNGATVQPDQMPRLCQSCPPTTTATHQGCLGRWQIP